MAPTTDRVRARTRRADRAAASFAVARIRARPMRGLVTGLGIAIAVASLLITVASPLIAGDATLRRALDDVAPGARSVTVAVSVNTRTVTQLRVIDAQVRSGLVAPGLGAVRGQIEYRALAASDGTVFRLAGVDGLADVVTLIDGRMPTECTPTHCEVVIVGAGTAVMPQPDLDLDVVGRVVLDDPGILSGQFAPDKIEVVLLGEGVEQVGAIAPLELIGRSLGWVAAIDPASVRLSDIDSVLAAAARTANSFSQGGGTVDLPRNAIVDARARAETARNRVALAAAQGAVLLVAFALLAAASMRRGHRGARDLLRQRGATRLATNVFTVCEAAWPVAIGLVVGMPLGLLATGWIARSWNFAAGDVVSEVLAASAGRLVIGTLIVLLATSVVMASGGTGSLRQNRRWWQPGPIDAVGIAALAVGALAVGRGSATPASLVNDGDPLLAALPVLAALCVGWTAVRIVPLLVAGLARLVGGRAPLARTALGEVARRPAVPLVTAGFLAAATTLGLFCIGYRSTLAAGAHDQAAFAVPLDFTLTSGPALVRPSALEPSAGWAALAPGTTATEVLRRGTSVRSQQLTNDTVTVLGIDPAAVREMRGWRRDIGPSQATVASAITPSGTLAEMGTPIPRDATQLTINGSGDLRITDIGLILQRADGTWHQLSTQFSAATPNQVVGTLDDGDAGGRLIGFRLGQPGVDSAKIEHHVGEGSTSAAFFTSTVHLITVAPTDAAGGVGTPLPIDWSVLGSDGAVVTQADAGLTVQLRLQGTTALVLPPTPAQLGQLAAVVDPLTAASAENGLLVIDIPGENRMSLRVAAVAERFPGAPSRFAVVDRSGLQLAFDLLDAGFGTANEVWLAAPNSEQSTLASALRAAPFDQLVVSRRTVIEDRLSSDPLSQFTLGLFGVAALIAMALAVAAMYLATLSDAADQAPLHRALAAEGVAPRALSRMVRTSGAAIAVGALAIGTIGSLLLLRVVTRVIAVTATSTVPVPPLLANVSAIDLVIAVALIAAPCLAATAVAARAARRAAQGDLLREFG